MNDVLQILCDHTLTCPSVAMDGGTCIHHQVVPMLFGLTERGYHLGEALSSLAYAASVAATSVASLDDATKLTAALARAGEAGDALTRCTSQLTCCLSRVLCGCESIE